MENDLCFTLKKWLVSAIKGKKKYLWMYVSGWTRTHDLAISDFDASFIYKKLNYARFQQLAYTSDKLKWYLRHHDICVQWCASVYEGLKKVQICNINWPLNEWKHKNTKLCYYCFKSKDFWNLCEFDSLLPFCHRKKCKNWKCFSRPIYQCAFYHSFTIFSDMTLQKSKSFSVDITTLAATTKLRNKSGEWFETSYIPISTKAILTMTLLYFNWKLKLRSLSMLN